MSKRREALRRKFIEAFEACQREGFTKPADYAAVAMQVIKRPGLPYTNCGESLVIPELCQLCYVQKTAFMSLYGHSTQTLCNICYEASNSALLDYHAVSEPHDKEGRLIVVGDLVRVLVRNKPYGTAQLVNAVHKGLTPKKDSIEKLVYYAPSVVLSSGYRVRGFRVLLEQ